MDCVGILLQKYPHEVSETEATAKLSSVAGMESIHSLHVWELTEGCTIATVHVTIHQDHDPMQVLKECQNSLGGLGIKFSTVQVETNTSGTHKHL